MKANWHDAKVLAVMREAGMSGLADGAEHILTVAIDQTPVDTGTLRRSGAVTEAPSENAVYVSFNTPYAVKQHEDLTLKHKEGNAKYLENALNSEKAKVLALVAARVKAALAGR
jgi:hypothetical protein